MSVIVRQSTSYELSIGPVLDADGVAVTDCVVADFKIKKTTGNFAALNGSATLTHVSAGTYDLVLTTSDLDTVGLATIAIDDGANACASVRLQVIEEAVFDALFAASATGLLPSNLTQIGGDAQSAADLKDFADAGYDPSSNKVQGVVLVDTTTTNTDMIGATGIRSAVGLASANLDTQLNEIATNQADQATVLAAVALVVDGIATALTTVGTNVTTLINRIGAFSGSGDNTIKGFFLATLRKNAPLPSDIGGTYAVETDSLEAQQEAGGGGGSDTWTEQEKDDLIAKVDDIYEAVLDLSVGAGTGPIAITVKVVDENGAPVPNAVVAAYKNGSLSGWGTANQGVDDNERQLFLTAGVNEFRAALDGWQQTTIPLTSNISANGELEIELQQLAISAPDDPDKTTGYFMALQVGVGTAGLRFVVQMVTLPTTNPNGYAFDFEPKLIVSGADGLTQMPFLHPTAGYKIRDAERSTWFAFTATGSAGGSFQVKGFGHNA